MPVNHCTHLGLVAVDEGTKFIILVYCDLFYEQFLYIFLQLLILTMIFFHLKL